MTSPLTPQQELQHFFEVNRAKRGRIIPGRITPSDLIPPPLPAPHLTPFAAIHDTYLFTMLIKQMFALVSPAEIASLVDLGAGSCVPTLRSLIDYPDFHTEVVAVDIDPDTVKIGKKNIDQYGLTSRYSFENRDLLQFLSDYEFEGGMAVVANPPYLPVPSGTTDTRFLPVDGGEDGTKFLMPILSHPYPKGTLLALEWCSLSNPHKILKTIQEHFEVLYVQAYDIPYGIYTEDPVLKPFLLERGEAGTSVFTISDDGKLSWTFIGVVLRKK